MGAQELVKGVMPGRARAREWAVREGADSPGLHASLCFRGAHSR